MVEPRLSEKKRRTLTLEQQNRILRQHRRLTTLSVEELTREVELLAAEPYRTVDLQLLFDSAKTAKAREQLEVLTKHPRPDVSRLARRALKIRCFRKRSELTAEGVTGPAEAARYFMQCAERIRFGEFYTNYHLFAQKAHLELKRRLMPNRAAMAGQLRPLILEDLRRYQENCEATAAGNAEPDQAILVRLKLARQVFDYLGLDFGTLAKPYLLDVHALASEAPYTLRERISALGLEVDGRVSHTNYGRHLNASVGYRLFQRGLLDPFLLLEGVKHCSFMEPKLSAVVLPLVQRLELVDLYPLERLDPLCLTAAMLRYHCRQHKVGYDEGAVFEREQLSQAAQTEGWPAGMQVDRPGADQVELVARIQRYHRERPDYVAEVLEPVHVLLQARQDQGEAFERYPHTDEPVAELFERCLLSKRLRFLNSDHRGAAMRCLVIGALCHDRVAALPRVVRFLAACCARTSSQAERQQLLQLLSPGRLLAMVLACLQAGLVHCDIAKTIGDVGAAYLTQPQVVQRLTSDFNDCLHQLLQQVAVSGPQLAEHFHAIVTACAKLRMAIPLVRYTVPSVRFAVPPTVAPVLRADFARAYFPDKDGQGVCHDDIYHKYATARTCAEFRELVVAEVAIPTQYYYGYFDGVVRQLATTQPYYTEQRRRVEAARKAGDEQALRQLQFEQYYVEDYRMAVNAVRFTREKLSINTVDVPEKGPRVKLLHQFNDVVKTVAEDYKALNNAVRLLEDIVRGIFAQGDTITLKSRMKDTHCHTVDVASRILDSYLEECRYLTSQHKAYYDKERMSSQFKVSGLMELHQDVLEVTASVLTELRNQPDRYARAKAIVGRFATVYNQLAVCDYDLQDEYQKYFTAVFSTKERLAAKNKGSNQFGAFRSQLDALRGAFHKLAATMRASDIVGLATELLGCYLFANFAVSVLGEARHTIQLDPAARLDGILKMRMPLSALKTAIKLMFQSQGAGPEAVEELFNKSSIDTKVCVLQHYYQRVLDDGAALDSIERLVSCHCKDSPECMQLFMASFYMEECHRAANTRLLMAMAPAIEGTALRLTELRLLDMAGWLGVRYPGIDETALLEAVRTHADTDVQLPQLVRFLYSNWADNAAAGRIEDFLVTCVRERLEAQDLCFQDRLLGSSIVSFLADEAPGRELYAHQVSLYVKLGRAFQEQDRVTPVFQLAVRPDMLSGSQINDVLLLLCAGDAPVDPQAAIRLLDAEGLTAFSRAYLAVAAHRGVSRALLQELVYSERVLLAKMAHHLGVPYYETE